MPCSDIFVGGRTVLEAMDSGHYSPSARYHDWVDVTKGDIQVFFAHLIIMGLVKKNKLIRYWARTEFVSTPFFGKYLGRKHFEKVMTQLHLNNNANDDQSNPLFKLRPFVHMCQKNFRQLYEPSKCLSLDEACCPLKGK